MSSNSGSVDRNGPSEDRRALTEATTWVVKVGSRSLTDESGRLDLDQVGNLANQLVALQELGKRVVLVSSGAVASGMGKLGLKSRPSDLATLQAVAAIGQAHLIQVYEKTFATHSKHAAQILLTAAELDDRVAYLNVRNTLTRLLELGAIPIINENDSVAVDELKTTFGDNDRLAGMVAGLLYDSALVILSDVHGLYDRDPQDPQAIVLSSVAKIDESIEELVRDRKTGISKGGMASKLTTAKFLTHRARPPRSLGGVSQTFWSGWPMASGLEPFFCRSRNRWFHASVGSGFRPSRAAAFGSIQVPVRRSEVAHAVCWPSGSWRSLAILEKGTLSRW